MKIVNDTVGDLNAPFEIENTGLSNLFKKKKIHVVMHYEDGSYKDFWFKLKKDYAFTINNKKYFIVPDCILRGKRPKIEYYYNNPLPISFKYQYSKLNAFNIRDQDAQNKLNDAQQKLLAGVTIDAEAIHHILDTSLLRGLYAENKMTSRGVLIIAAIIILGLFAVLQATGTVDILGWIQGGAPK